MDARLAAEALEEGSFFDDVGAIMSELESAGVVTSVGGENGK